MQFYLYRTTGSIHKSKAGNEIRRPQASASGATQLRKSLRPRLRTCLVWHVYRHALRDLGEVRRHAWALIVGPGIGRSFTTDDRCALLEQVRSLRPGQQVGGSVMRDNTRRPMVTLEEVTKIAEQLNPIRADMLWLLWYTGARPGEVCQMRPIDIVKGDPDCWLYVPGSDVGPSGRHKTSYRGRVHVIPLAGPAKAILERRVTQWDSKEYVFQPAQSMREWHGQQLLRRDTPMSTGNRPGTNRTGDSLIKPGACFKPVSLNTAFHRACDRVSIAPFTPYDLRRSTATRVRAQIDKEAAKSLLGHSSTNVTDIYLLDEVAQAVKVAKIMAHG
jgi:integrase